MKNNEVKKTVSRNIETENEKVLAHINSLKHDIFSIIKTDKQSREVLQLQFVENANVSQRAEIWVKKQRAFADMYIGRNTTLFANAEKLAYKDALQHKMSKNEIMLTFNTVDELNSFFSSVYATNTTKKATTKKSTKKASKTA
jgi:hypothetical protein